MTPPKASWRRGHVTATVVAVVMSLSACGVQTDDAVRIIPPAERGDLSATVVVEGNPIDGASRIFLLGSSRPGVRSLLRAVPRDVAGLPQPVLDALIAGPTATEQAQQLRSASPEGTQILNVSFVAPGTIAVDLDETLFEATGDELIDAMAQIVFSATDLERVARVSVLIAGQARQLPRGDGQLVSGPFTVFDFPERVASTQPDYPARPRA
jgi:hypothetical protein